MTPEIPKEGLAGPAPAERPHPSGRRDARGVRRDADRAVEDSPQRTILSALVEDEPGVLARIAGLFSRRQFNIDSLTVGPTTVQGHSRITLVVEEPRGQIAQIERQLAKLKPVISVGELDDDAVRTEVVLMKVRGQSPADVQAVVAMFDGQTIDAGSASITVQISGDEQTIDDAIDAFDQFGIIEIARTGYTALARGMQPTVPGEKPGTANEPTVPPR
jgi:acetolactate synthase-1/3 small subunit